jgi:hypothetical protein
MGSDSGVANRSVDFEMRLFWTHFDAPLEHHLKFELFGKLDGLNQFGILTR